MGKIVRALSAEGGVLCSAIDSADMVREMARLHNATPVVTAALGRMTTAVSIMGAMLKYEGDTLTLRINGGGPCGTLTAVSDYRGNVKCCAGNPGADVPPTADGALDVRAVIGSEGSLTVVKDMGLKEPYVGQIPLVSGNIAEDITAYYSVSEQLPTVCALGILFDGGGGVRAAGGYMVQVVPPIEDASVRVLEENLAKMDGISRMLERRLDPSEIALRALSGLGGEILDSWEARYYCDCSRERTERVLISLGRKELARLAEEQEETEVCCHFCNKKYKFSAEDMLKLLKE
ncbi:MAG: Hsp33 family molecular chaperone HslO [Lachnospiraceae bacterium]|nr:Hsp33 family molecular chaperone HslO [Ruminococcus sp.]MCM1275697.1 Hsp33 family molecular chaperone HslO [Lachnospiraceae bacterium]